MSGPSEQQVTAKIERRLAKVSAGKKRDLPPARGGGRRASSRAPVFLAGANQGNSEQLKSAIRDAAEAATDFSWLSRGDPVFIKPVLNSGNPYPDTTSPLAVGAMIEVLKEKGAGRIIVGDMSGVEHVKLSKDRLRGSTRTLMGTSGLAATVMAAGGELHAFEEGGWDDFYAEPPTAGSNWQGELMMPNILREVEHIILMPRCGRHVLAGASLGLKAAVGYWRTDTRLEYHRDASTFHEKTAEGNTAATLLNKQRLVLTAADKVLATFGPDDGRVCQPQVGLVIASESVVAHDMISLAWLIETRREMPFPRDSFRDKSQLLARFANRVVVGFLANWKTALNAETLTKNDLRSIGDDRVLNHAYRVLGGRPEIVLEAVNDLVPEELQRRLSRMSTPSEN
ncbi:MAG: DUF362 domain-containing protein [Anaerolineae bacterium]|jgi:uncharacterized protein (DUF362 family)